MPPQSLALNPRRRSLEVGSVWALIATLVVAIVVITPSLTVSLAVTKTFILAAGTLLTLALYILARLSRGNIVFPPFLLIGAFWLPAIAYGLSSMFSGAPLGNALWGSALETDTFGFMLIAACLGTLATLILRRSEQYNSFLRAGVVLYVGVVLVQAAIVLYGQVAPDSLSPAFTILGSFQDLSLLLGLGVVCTLITFRFFEVQGRASNILVVVTIISLILLAVANSWFVWVLLALVSLGLFIEGVMMRRPGSNDSDLDQVSLINESSSDVEGANHSIAFPLLVLAVSLFFMVGGNLSGYLANALNVNVVSVSPSWQSTLSVAKQTYATSPLFGTGPGSFGSEWLKYRDPSLNSTVFWNVDFNSGIGFVPTSFVTTGLIGAVAWMLFFVLFIAFGIRMLVVRTPEDPYVRYVAILSFVATIYLFASSIFSLPGAVILVLGFVFAGLFASTMRFGALSRQRGIVFAQSPRLGFIIVFSLTLVLLGSVMVAYTLVGRYVATSELAKANAAFSQGKLNEADQAVKNAIEFAPSAMAYQAQADIAIVRLGQIVSSSTMPAAAAQESFQAALSTGINAALTATRLAPANYQNWLALGNLYAQAVPLSVTGAYDSAKTAFDKAVELNPTNPEIRYIVAQLEIAHKNNKAAKESLKKAISLKQDYLNAIFLLSQLEVQDGNIKEALASALTAAYFAPKDANILFQVGVLSAAQNDYKSAAAAFEAAVASNPQFANARFFLAAIYFKQGKVADSLAQMEEIAALSKENAGAVAEYITKLQAGKNPFPANLLSETSTPVKQ